MKGIDILFCAAICFAKLVDVSGKLKKSPQYVTSFSPGGQYIVLTFENGPHSLYTNRIMEILGNKSIHATFFVNGNKAFDNPHLIRQIINDGHEIANYGFYDVNINSTHFDTVIELDCIYACSRIIHSIVNQSTNFYRPKYGVVTNHTIIQIIKQTSSMETILENIDFRKIPTPSKAVKKIQSFLDKKIKPGDIITMLDTSYSTVAVLPTILDNLISKYYEFLTLSQIWSFPDDKPRGR